MVHEGESTHQLDRLSSGGSVGTGVVFLAIGEFGRGLVTSSCQSNIYKIDEPSSQEEASE